MLVMFSYKMTLKCIKYNKYISDHRAAFFCNYTAGVQRDFYPLYTCESRYKNGQDFMAILHKQLQMIYIRTGLQFPAQRNQAYHQQQEQNTEPALSLILYVQEVHLFVVSCYIRIDKTSQTNIIDLIPLDKSLKMTGFCLTYGVNAWALIFTRDPQGHFAL